MKFGHRYHCNKSSKEMKKLLVSGHKEEYRLLSKLPSSFPTRVDLVLTSLLNPWTETFAGCMQRKDNNSTYMVIYRIAGKFGKDFNLAVW